MIKNLVFDIGGVILTELTVDYFDLNEDEKKNLNKIIFYDKRFRKCLNGDMKVDEYLSELIKENSRYKKEIEMILGIKYQKYMLPIKKDVLELLYELKKDYNIYFLSNLTDVSYDYLYNEVGILKDFPGIYSFKEHMQKPNEEIYELLIKRFNLIKEETVFFDNTQRNVDAGNKVGIKSILFKDILDILNNIN